MAKFSAELACDQGARSFEHVEFAEIARAALGEPLRARVIDTLQLNLGKVCNQACKHCHVDAGPNRTETMDAETADACIEVVRRHAIAVVDITGGAPEINPNFRRLVAAVRRGGARVIVRHNFTVQSEAGQEDLPEFFAAQDVELIASLPHYLAQATDRQRGAGVFERSIVALGRLNAVGYGTGRADRSLVLAYNPIGAFLPAGQAALERDFKRALASLHVTFDRLVAFTNMPVGRFRDWLEKTGQYDAYQERLEGAFNPAAVGDLMCRTLVSVSWDGRLFDCDFNQMIDLSLAGPPLTIRDFDAALLARRPIATASHCFGCTAGSGFS
jgi:radical SAM/Cys-rich protein